MSALPSSAQYSQLPLGVSAQRRTVKQIPVSGQGDYRPDTNQTIRINLPQQGFMDNQNSYLVFRHEVRTANDAGSVAIANTALGTLNWRSLNMMDRGAFSWIKNLRILGSDGQVLENIQNYNLLMRMLHRATQPEDYTQSSNVEGFEPDGVRAGRAEVGYEYAIQLNGSGILSASKYLPLKYLQGGLTIEMELAPALESHKLSDSTHIYKLSSVRYVMDLVEFSDEFDMMFRQRLLTEGVNIHFDTYTSHILNLSSGGAQEHQISERSSSVKGVYSLMRPNTWINSQYRDSLGEWDKRRLNEYQFILGTTQYPRFPVQCDSRACAESSAELRKSFNGLGDLNGGSEIDSRNYAGDCSGPDKQVPIYLSAVSKQVAQENYVVLDRFNPMGGAGVGAGSGNGSVNLDGAFRRNMTGLKIKGCVDDDGNLEVVPAADGTQQAAGASTVCPPVGTSINTPVATNRNGGLLYIDGRNKANNDQTKYKCYNMSSHFLIGQNFETAQEHGQLQSGQVSSGAVPLSIKLGSGFSSGDLAFNDTDRADATEGDDGTGGTIPTSVRMDIFVHSDKMLSVGADGLASVSH